MPDQQLRVLEAEGAGSILLYIGPPRELRVGLAFPLPGDPGKEAACGCELSRDVQMQTGVQAPIWATPLSGLQPHNLTFLLNSFIPMVRPGFLSSVARGCASGPL